MAFAPSRSLILPLFPSSFPFKQSMESSLRLPLRPSRNAYSPLASASSSHNQPPSPFTPEQAVLEALADSEVTQNSLPVVRTYENDLARLTLVGAVDFQQAITAAAADGGEAADEHISSGIAAMVVETIFPGPDDDHSTVSTRLVSAQFLFTYLDCKLSRIFYFLELRWVSVFLVMDQLYTLTSYSTTHYVCINQPVQSK